MGQTRLLFCSDVQVVKYLFESEVQAFVEVVSAFGELPANPRTFCLLTSGREAIFFNTWPMGVLFIFSRICSISRSSSAVKPSNTGLRLCCWSVNQSLRVKSVISVTISIKLQAKVSIFSTVSCQPLYLVCPINPFRDPMLLYSVVIDNG